MKKIFTFSLITLFTLSFSLNLFAQCVNCNDPVYAQKKADFWKVYLEYKSNLDHNNVVTKPIDPNGLFMIDENNHFAVKTPPNSNGNSPSGPWIPNPQPNAIGAGMIFSQSTTTYTPAYNGTAICVYPTFCDDTYFSTIPIGFTFNYNGSAWTTVSISCNGWLMMGTGTPSGYSPIATGSYANAIVPFARDLLGNNAADSLRYLTTGASPNRVFVVEWSHWGIYSSGNNEIDFQIRFYESTNIIQFVYKPETPTTSITDVQIGIMGTTNADYKTRTTTTNWSTTTEGTASSYNTFNSSVYPASGLTFSWIPNPTSFPQYYNYNIAGSANSFPFNVTSPGKECQWLIKAGDLNQPGPAISGLITSLSFYMGGTGGPSVFPNLRIKLVQDTITTLPTGAIYTNANFQSVYFSPSTTLSSTIATWMNIPIMPFTYNPNLSLIVDVGQCGYTGTSGMTVYQQTGTGFRRTYITGASDCSPTYGGQDASIVELGVNILSTTPPGPMGYVSSNTIQLNQYAANVGNPILPGSLNNQIIKIQIVDTQSLSPFLITRFRLETTGSNNPAVDILNAKLWYTRSVNAFSTARQFGSTVAGPNGVFNITAADTVTLDPDATNYFWLTYDLTPGAVWPDSVDAQCDSIIGTSPMGGQVPTTVAPAGSNPIDAYCRGMVSNNGCGTNMSISNVTFGSINNTTGCNPNLPFVYTPYPTLTTTVRQNNQYPINCSVPAYGNPTLFGVWIDWNNNNSFAEVNEYTQPPPVTSALTNPTTGTVIVPPGATLGTHRMRVRSSYASSLPVTQGGYCATLLYGEQEDYTVNVLADTSMYYSSSTTTQSSVANIYTPSPTTQIIGMQVVTAGTISPITASSFTFNTTGTSHPNLDITTAKLWYTGLNPLFASPTLYGVAVGPSGSFIIANGSFPVLAQGVNYFWLTYDIPSTAPGGDTVDAQCNSITVGGTPRIPTVQSPAGFRIIQGNALCGTYNIPGNYPSIAAAITDLNARGTPLCAVTYNIAAGWTEVASNLTVTSTGTSTAPITFQKSGTGDNPRIVAAPGTGSYDGIIKLYGVSYITFDGIDVSDTSSNTSVATQMEWGYALLRPDGTHGDQFNTIKNCNITLNKTNTSTHGIHSYYQLLTGGTVVPSASSGTNSNNSFLNVNITNSFYGMYLYGYPDSQTPYALGDKNNTVSTTGGGRSSITNFGGSAGTAYGIYSYYQSNITLSNTLITNRGGTGHTGALYGIYNYSYYNSGNATISGDTVTLADTTGAAGNLYAIYHYTYNGQDNYITNNVVRDCVNPHTSSYYNQYFYIYNASGSQLYQNSFTVTGNKCIGNTNGSATSTGSGTLTYDFYLYDYCNSFVNISNNLDSGNTTLGTTAYTGYVIYSPGAPNNAVNSNNRVVNNTFCGTTASGTIYGIYQGGGYYTCSMDSNVVANNNFPSTSSISFYNMYNTSPAPTSDYSYNTITGNTSSGSGIFYGMYFAASPLFGSTINITNNTITNLSKTTATGTGTIYGLNHSGSAQGTINILNNTITGFSSAAATTIYGLYQNGSPPNYLNINNNKVGNFNVAGAGTIYGIYNNPTASTVNTMSQDSVFNITSGGGTVYGMYTISGNPVTVTKCRISGITSTTSTSVSVYGLYIGGGTVNYDYDNFISDIDAPASTTYASPAVTGIYIAGGTYDYIYYNTIYLKDTSTSATSFGTAGIYASTTPNLDLRNNVVINNSTPGPTLGNVVAYWRSANSLPTYLTTSNNNCFYAGTPGARNLIFYDGTNLIQTLAAYKTFVLPRDNNSATEFPPFVNIATTPYDLRIQTGTGTQLESGGQIISTSGFPAAPINITQDAFGTSRYPNAGYPIGSYTPTAPDMGAHEFGGVNTDNVPPFISYTPLGTGGLGANRQFSNVVITDQSGVNVTSSFMPRCYYKRSTDSNVVNNTNTSTDDGWKYVQSNGTTSPFDFTIDYTKLVGGTGVSTGNIVQYFVIAQDLATTPNVGSNQAIFALAPTMDSLVSANAPITNPLSYTIGTTGSFSGNYNVGTAQTYTSLTGAGGIFAAINSSTVSGNVTITLTSNLYEDGTNALNATNETGVGGYTIKIVPATAALYTITGSVAQGMIRLNGAQRVTIDGGSFFSSDNAKWGYKIGNEPLIPGKYLTIRNNNISNPAITFINGAVNDTIKYCSVESNNYAGTSSGTIFFSTTTSLVTGNSNNVITNCDIRDNDSVTTSPTYSNGIYSLGTSTAYALYNTNNTIKNCNFYNNYYDIATTTAAIYMTSGTNSWIIQNNSFYQTVPRTLASSETICGIFNAATSAYGHQVIGNYFGGSAPLCGGSPMTYSGAGLYTIYGIQLLVGAVTPSSIQGNTIQNINLTESPASGSAVFFRGITVPTSVANVNIGNITGNTIGSGTGNGSITLTVNTTVTGYSGPICGIFSNGIGNISNNTVGSITVGGNAAATSVYAVQGIQWTSTTQNWTYNCNNNLVGSLTTPNSIQFTDSLSACQLRGIVCGNGLVTIDNFTNNTVANLTNWSQACATTTIASIVYGFSFSTAGNFTITNNNIYNLSLNTSAGLATFPATYLVIGISHSSQGINVINQNNIHSLYFNNPTVTGSGLNTGIFIGGETGTTASRNKIYDMRYSSIATTTSIMLSGISCASTAPGVMTISNNMICITNGDPLDNPFNKLYKQDIPTHENVNVPLIKQKVPESLLMKNKKVIVGYDPDAKVAEPLLSQAEVSNNKINNQTNKVNINGKNVQQNVNSAFTASIAGILTQVGSGVPPAPNTNFFYNTVYIGGTDAGSSSSWGFLKQFYGNLTVRNNLLINARTGAANHYAIGNEASPPANSWSATSSTYNTFIGPSDATIGEWGTANATTLAGWVAASGGDNQSYSSSTSNINPANLLQNIGTCDLRIVSANSSAWIVSGKGIALAGQGIDYEGTPRFTSISAGVTDIGADEFVATPPSNPVATQVGIPGAGGTSTYFLYGRKICSIDWGIGGTSYPTSMTVNYYSGINPPNTSTLGPNYSNSYWTVVPVGSLAGTTYNVTMYFGDNETYLITSPSTNTMLANYNNTIWQAFPPGINPLQSNLNWSILTLSPTLLSSINFSTYALADGSLTPSLIYPPYNALSMPTTDTLSWSSDPGVVTYHVQLGTDSTFASGLIVNDSTLASTSRIVSGLSNNITYFWRVREKFGTYNGPFVAPYKFRTSSGVALVSVTVIPGGFYSAGQLNMKDTIRIVLVDSATCTKVDSSKVLLDSVTFAATPSPTFVNAATGKYYIYVYHRNHLTISSMYTQNVIRGSNVSYDFTTDSSKTYGFNVVKVSTSPVKWGMIPGDANQDGYVDGLDQTIWVAENGANGYFGADFNGDTYVDGLDQTIWVGTNGSGTNLPCYFSIVTLPGPGKQNGQPTRVIINRGNVNNNVNKAIRENQKNQKQ